MTVENWEGREGRRKVSEQCGREGTEGGRRTNDVDSLLFGSTGSKKLSVVREGEFVDFTSAMDEKQKGRKLARVFATRSREGKERRGERTSSLRRT